MVLSSVGVALSILNSSYLTQVTWFCPVLGSSLSLLKKEPVGKGRVYGPLSDGSQPI
jgi:hypothetical protein